MEFEKELTTEESGKWTEIILSPDGTTPDDIKDNWLQNKNTLINTVAGFIYKELQLEKNTIDSPYSLKKEFAKLSGQEKSDWYDIADEIPVKLSLLNLNIRPYSNFCRTCLISFKDIKKFAGSDYERYYRKSGTILKNHESGQEVFADNIPFQKLADKRKLFFWEINLLIPAALKKAGYEIIRPQEVAEINDKLVKRLASVVHSRYIREIRKLHPENEKKSYLSLMHKQEDSNIIDFNKLPEEIKHSNLDNAFHIPTKLLSIGYKIRPAGKGFKPAALHLTEEEIEVMSMVEHLRWCWDKIMNGWHYGEVKDTGKKRHPGLKEYNELSEGEKEKDRELVRMIPSLLQDIGYEAYSINPERISKLPYAIKPVSSIHRILDETRRMNEQIRNIVTIPPHVDEILQIRNRKIEEAIREVESGYNYAQHIQETFLPDNLYVRKCFPESFILFRPKDIVSGDFYFFSRQENSIVFAAVDCTGHGIPGALLTTIGYSIIDQAVNGIKLKDPAKILHYLYSGMHKFLRLGQDGTGIQDDMDIILCILDTGTNVLTYSGVKNALYHVRNGELKEHKVINQLEECTETEECIFSSESISLLTGDILYLFSDGYADQFGGSDHKRYRTVKFKKFLLSVNTLPMAEQGDRLYEEIEEWREEKNEDQTDDILVIGIKI
jgi:serine phosphatase RsbU (regulator of sigma subunit)